MAVINGTAGADVLTGTEEDDQVNALAGNDLIKGSLGADRIDGGAGSDTVDYSASAEAVNVNIRQGLSLAGRGGDSEGDILYSIESVIGSDYDDTITVGPFSMAIGFRLEGGAGNDVYNIGVGYTPVIVEQAGGGDDEVRVSVINPNNTYLAENVERLTYVGAGNFTGYGNGLDNVITGGSGNDTLYGGAGADQFIGGAGYDTAGYLDSKEAMVLNLRTNVVSGIGTGDTFTSIEAFGGSNFNDVFYGGSTATGIDGAGGQDMVTYELSEEAVTIDLLTSTANKGDASGDTYTRVEIFQGSGFNDTLLGSNVGDTFIGGAGADTIDGRGGVDGVWYITNSTAVSINLQTQINQGGDAEGDVLLNIERVVGSHFDDVLIGDSGTNHLEGGLGNDLINGGDGNDYIYGGLYSQIAPFTLEGQTNGPQEDTLYGGNGNDNIVTAADDRGSRAYGEAGADVITVVHGMADGGDGNDVLTGTGLDFSLFGGAGDDKLVLKASGWAEGGEGDDTYTVDTSALVTIQDTGVSRGDKLVLSYIRSGELLMDRIGADLYLHRSKYTAGEEPKEGVLLKDWFAGYNTIEQIQTSDIQLISLPTSSSAMFA